MTGSCESKYVFGKERQVDHEERNSQELNASKMNGFAVGAQGYVPTFNFTRNKTDAQKAGTEGIDKTKTNHFAVHKPCSLHYNVDAVEGAFILFDRNLNDPVYITKLEYNDEHKEAPKKPLLENTPFYGFRAFCDGIGGIFCDDLGNVCIILLISVSVCLILG